MAAAVPCYIIQITISSASPKHAVHDHECNEDETSHKIFRQKFIIRTHRKYPVSGSAIHNMFLSSIGCPHLEALVVHFYTGGEMYSDCNLFHAKGPPYGWTLDSTCGRHR